MNPLSKTEQARLEAMFRHAFGRDLTQDERRFLQLSYLVETDADDRVRGKSNDPNLSSMRRKDGAA